MAVKQACPFRGKHVRMALKASKPFTFLPYERRIYDNYVMAEADVRELRGVPSTPRCANDRRLKLRV